MKNLKKYFVLLSILSVLVSAFAFPAAAASTTEGGLIDWDGVPTSAPYYNEAGEYYFWLELVSPSVPDLSYLQSNGITVQRVLDDGSGANASEQTLMGSSSVTGIFPLSDNIYGNGVWLVWFCDKAGASATMYGVKVTFPRAGTYLVRRAAPDNSTYRYCSQLIVPGFDFLPTAPTPTAGAGIFYDIYDIFSYYVFGPGVSLTPLMELVCTTASFTCTLFVFALPFLLVLLYVRKLVF